MDIDKKEEGLLSFLLQPQPYRRWLSKKYYFREPPCLSRRRVVFSLFKNVFRNRYALIARTIPFNTSLLNSKRVSIVVHLLSLKNKKRIVCDNRHPYNFWLYIYFIIIE